MARKRKSANRSAGRGAALPAPQSQPQPQQRPRRRWTGAAAVVLLVVFTVGAAGWMWQRGGTPGGVGGGGAAVVPAALFDEPIVEPEAAAFARYAGSATCRECHSDAYNLWASSNHGLAERPVTAALDHAAFEPPRSFTHGTQTTEPREVEGQPRIIATGFGGERKAYAPVRVIGNDPLRQFLVAGEGGRLQAMEAAYDPHRNEWFNVYGAEDRQPGEWGHWTGRGMTWNSMCAACHNTRLRKNYDPATDAYATRMAEPTVSCESCHGPMKSHVDWQAAHPGPPYSPAATKAKAVDPTIKPVSREGMFQTCGSCHSRRGELTGDFTPGDSYFDHYSLVTVDGSDLYYPDGQVRDEDYEFGSFLGSRMHAAGVRCVDCHQPHAARPVTAGNDLCMRCHAAGVMNAPKIDPPAHSFHKPDSAGNSCVGCHMPVTTYMQRHPRHDHGFTSPDPLLTRERGIPNACNRCHTDKDADWALEHARQWYGEKLDRPARDRARAVAAARRGDDAARAPLLGMMSDPKQTPYWRAVSAGLLGRWVMEPSVRSALRRLGDDPDPLVRSAAVRALASMADQADAGGASADPATIAALERRLDDPARSVRIAAGWALRAGLDPQTRAGREVLHMLDHNADQPGGQVQLAGWHVARNDWPAAFAAFDRAVAWDPRSAAVRMELAVAYSLRGRPQEALEQLQAASRLDPNDADCRFRLGLAWNEVGRVDQTVASLRDAVRLDPRHGRAWYNLGLALNQMGRPDEAIDALLHAEGIDPRDPTLPYARATIELSRHNTDAARAAAMKALEINPRYAPAVQLLQSAR